jgi:vitamin B12 transporter
LRLLLSSCLAALPVHAVAQPTDADAGAPVAPAAPTPQLTPPVLIDAPSADYPEPARAQRLEGSVLFELIIDEQGAVSAANVLEPAGQGFDEAATAAVLRFRFEPARRDGQPMRAKLRYRYDFKLPASTADEPQPAESVATPAPPPTVIAPPEPISAPPASSAPAQHEVTVSGTKSDASRLRQSAEAVSVIELREARQQTVDLGEVLARSQGIAVQRDAGLGSNVRFSLNGMSGAAVKFFVDGVPLDESGYPALADIPVNLVDRVEIYRGVVPIRFGADALGGAINIVTDSSQRKHIGASYQVGSFGIHRANANARYIFPELGLRLRASGFYDYAANNYKVSARVPDENLRVVDAIVERNHDAYRSYGARLEVGVVDRSWARQLLLTGFLNDSSKEYQSDPTQTIPYGEVHGTTAQYGATLRYTVDFAPNVALDVTANYAHSRFHLRDVAEWVYDWYGKRVRRRRIGGELDPRDKSDLVTWENRVFGRALLEWKVAPNHIVRLMSTPETPWRDGEERYENLPGERNRGSAKRRMITVVTGLEYEATALEERFSNIVLLKHYWQRNMGEERVLWTPGGSWLKRENTVNHLGFGDAMRFRFLQWLHAKASYEYATRLPEPEEYLGDGLLIGPNYALLPEVSHNGNLGLRAELSSLPIGELSAELNGFIRGVTDQIALIGAQRQTHINIGSTRGTGVDGSLLWISPGRYVTVNGMLTWTDIRNTSEQGSTAEFKGQRVPSDPWLFGGWGVRFSLPDLGLKNSRLEPFYNGRYVRAFNRSWEGLSDQEFRIGVPKQIMQSAGVTWVLSLEQLNLNVTFEVDNLGDAKVFDVYGAQRPGRGYYFKVAGDLR